MKLIYVNKNCISFGTTRPETWRCMSLIMPFDDLCRCDEKESAFKYHQIKQHNEWVQALKLLPYELLYDSSVLRASLIQIKPCFSLQKRTKC